MARVLVVDPDEATAASISSALAGTPCNTAAATGALDGLRAACEAPADVMVVAADLGDGSGFDLARQVLDLSLEPALILVSEALSPETTLQALRMGFFDCFSKPLTGYDELRRRILEAIERDAKKRSTQFEAQQLRTMTFADPLTGLANRALILHEAARALRSSADIEDYGVALAHGDVDDFQRVNQALGQQAGNRVLQEIASRLKTVSGTHTLARIGADEFAVLVEGRDAERNVEEFVAGAESALKTPIEFGGEQIPVTARWGIAHARRRSQDPGVLLRNAEIAKTSAKTRGAPNAIFETGMHTIALDQWRLEADLRGAAERGELRCHYQPIVDLATSCVVGFESLVRWEHPTRGLVSPGAFLPVAEKSGNIVDVGKWVLRESVEQLARWHDVNPDLYMSINVSPAQMAREDFVDQVQMVLEDTGVDPHLVVLEITENMFVEESEVVSSAIARISEAGVKLAMDDFGTGYSSLSYLFRFPFDILKIDQFFVKKMKKGDRRESLVRAVLALAEAFGMRVVAEGIELEEHLESLIGFGCPLGQGWHFERALPSHEAERLVVPGITLPQTTP